MYKQSNEPPHTVAVFLFARHATKNRSTFNTTAVTKNVCVACGDSPRNVGNAGCDRRSARRAVCHCVPAPRNAGCVELTHQRLASEQRERARLARLPNDELCGSDAWQAAAGGERAVVVGGGIVGVLSALRLAVRLGPVRRQQETREYSAKEKQPKRKQTTKAQKRKRPARQQSSRTPGKIRYSLCQLNIDVGARTGASAAD